MHYGLKKNEDASLNHLIVIIPHCRNYLESSWQDWAVRQTKDYAFNLAVYSRLVVASLKKSLDDDDDANVSKEMLEGDIIVFNYVCIIIHRCMWNCPHFCRYSHNISTDEQPSSGVCFH